MKKKNFLPIYNRFYFLRDFASHYTAHIVVVSKEEKKNEKKVYGIY